MRSFLVEARMGFLNLEKTDELITKINSILFRLIRTDGVLLEIETEESLQDPDLKEIYLNISWR